jgi:LysM repeat protein
MMTVIFSFINQTHLRMKRVFFTVAALLFFFFSFAQTELLVQSNEKGLFLTHTISAKENFYSIGRMYNVPPKEIAAFNFLDMSRGLSVGQSINIPLTAANFTQTAQTGMPVYYLVGDKEGLYRVSTKHNKVPMANLRKWNNLTGEAIYPGQKLIVGYLNSTESVTTVANVTPAMPKPEVKETQPLPAPVQAKTEPVAVTKKEEAKIVATTTGDPKFTNTTGSGYFKNQFELQLRKNPASKDETATAGIFKTTSGWQDGKYYALIDNVEPGTIIRVINPTNNKAVYAKVLGEMSGIRQNQGLGVRISNAAASALDIAEDDKFIVKVNY